MLGIEIHFIFISLKIKIIDLQAKLTIIMNNDDAFFIWKETLEKYKKEPLINPNTSNIFKANHEERLLREGE